MRWLLADFTIGYAFLGHGIGTISPGSWIDERKGTDPHEEKHRNDPKNLVVGAFAWKDNDMNKIITHADLANHPFKYSFGHHLHCFSFSHAWQRNLISFYGISGIAWAGWHNIEDLNKLGE